MNVTQKTEPGETPGIAAAPANSEFAAILNQAKDVDTAANTAIHGEPPPAPALPVEVLDPAAAWAEIPAVLGQLLCMGMPELTEVYSKQACYAWGVGMARVAAKRNWDASGMPPEVTVAVSTLMFAVPTVAVIKMRSAQAKRAAQARKEAQAMQPQQATDGSAAG